MHDSHHVLVGLDSENSALQQQLDAVSAQLAASKQSVAQAQTQLAGQSQLAESLTTMVSVCWRGLFCFCVDVLVFFCVCWVSVMAVLLVSL